MKNPTREQMQQLEAQNLSQIEKTHTFFIIRDLDGNGFGLPTPALSTAHYLRELESNLSPKHQMAVYAKRFEIYETGAYNYLNGNVLATEPRLVGVLSDLIRLPEAQTPQ